jgi:hypothetical protein
MGEKKTTVFEINIEEVELSPRLGGELGEKLEKYERAGSKLGLFDSTDTDAGEEATGAEDRDEDAIGEPPELDDEAATEVEVEDEADAEGGSGGIALVIGLVFLVLVATVVKKFVVDSEPEEYEEVELSEYES